MEGYKVIGQLASGNGLLEALVQTVPDLICLNYHLPGCDSYVRFGVVAPAATPATIMARLNAALAAKAASTPTFRGHSSEQGHDVLNSTPKQATRSERDEISNWGKIVRVSGAMVD